MSNKVFHYQGIEVPVEVIAGKRFRLLYALFDKIHKRLYAMVAKAAQNDVVLQRFIEYERARTPVEEQPPEKKTDARHGRKVTLLSDVEGERQQTTDAISRQVARSRTGRGSRYAGGTQVVEANPADVMYIRSSRG